MARTHTLIAVAFVVVFAIGAAVGWLLAGRQRPTGPSPSAAQAAGAPATSSSWIGYLPQESKSLQSVQVERWAFRYTGGPMDWWVDVEESERQTTGEFVFFTGKRGVHAPDGTFSFMIRQPFNGGAREGILASSLGQEPGTGYGPMDGLWFGWKRWGSSWAPFVEGDKGRSLKAGEEITLLHYEATEWPDGAPTPGGRSVKLKLKARLSDP